MEKNMEKTQMLSVEEFLKTYGFEQENLNDKEKVKALKQIILSAAVDKDCEEDRYTKNIDSQTRNEYVSKIHNLTLLQMQAQHHIFKIKRIQKEQRRLKRKEGFEKVIGVFKK